MTAIDHVECLNIHMSTSEYGDEPDLLGAELKIEPPPDANFVTNCCLNCQIHRSNTDGPTDQECSGLGGEFGNIVVVWVEDVRETVPIQQSTKFREALKNRPCSINQSDMAVTAIEEFITPTNFKPLM
ncbi:MAG: hypothetical protein AAB557_03645 [Patescibacteria group bacterium]